jgi:hypothetical protein
MKNKTSTGIYSTGDWSTGSYSTGNYSTGDYSTGDHSTGNRSTGNHSTGDRSTGVYSTGNFSTGHFSTGNCSTGGWSTGNYSTGSWSISNYSTGHFSTEDYSGFGAFNKPCTIEEWDSAETPAFLYFGLIEWVTLSDMTEQEKIDNPSCEIIGGYSKPIDYKEAWRKAWNSATDEDKELLYALPNFDAEVFKEISGIDVNKEIKPMTVEEIEKELGCRIKIKGGGVV